MKSKFFILISILIISVCTTSLYAKNKTSVYLNGKELSSDQEPIILNGTSYVPMRCIFEAFGFEVDWNSSKKRIKAIKEDDNYIMLLQVESKTINICGNVATIDNAPIIVNNRVMIPLRAVSEKLNASVDWNSQNKTVTILTKTSSVSAPTSNDFNYENYSKSNFWSDETWKITPKTNSDDTAFEKEVFNLVNAERAKENIAPLKWNDKLADVARAHSQDMKTRNFFSHENPDGESPFDRMEKAGFSYSFAGENVAVGQKTAKDVMNSWMNSQGHRENILNPDFKEIGIGKYGNYWTQCFITQN